MAGIGDGAAQIRFGRACAGWRPKKGYRAYPIARRAAKPEPLRFGRADEGNGSVAYVLGIDVGTTYTAAATATPDRAEIFQLGSQAASIPTIVVLRTDGQVLTGEAAERRAQTEPARTAREFKRRLGDPVPLLLGGTPYDAEALYAQMLRSVVAQVTQQRGEGPRVVVITHPASYGPYKLDLLQQAVRQAGIGDAMLLSEPVAAAIHYADQERVEAGTVVAVYDFGGGTFDAAVLRKTSEGFQLLGEAGGLERLGGIDFDQAVLALVDTETSGAIQALNPSDPAARAVTNRLRDECRRTKEALSSDIEGVIPVLLPSLQTEVRLTREAFEELVRPRVAETIAALERAVRSAGLTFAEIDRILLVGGSSRIPVVGALVHEATGRPIAIDANPKHAIALGAAIFGREKPPATPPAHRLPGLSTSPRPQRPEPPEPAAEAVPLAGAAMAFAGAPAAAAVTPGLRDGGPRRRPALAAIAGVAVVAIVAAAALAVMFTRGGGETRTASGADGADGRALAAAPSSTATPQVSATGTPVTASPSPTPAPLVATVAAPAVAGTPTVAAPPTPSPTPPASPAPTLTATPPATASAVAVAAAIGAIKVSGARYDVSFTTSGYTPSLAGKHVHFYFNTASTAGGGLEYAGTSPFTGVGPADRPQGAQQMCIVVANADHSVIAGSGNCVNLPVY